jgi:hypothetical protein
MHRLGLLPAAGSATRMRGLPKFLLPIGDGPVTLLERQIILMLEACEQVLVPTSPQNKRLVETLKLHELGDVRVIALSSETMAETVFRSLGSQDFDQCLLGMPDTYFQANPYPALALSNAELSVGVWNSRPDQIGKLGSVSIDEGLISNVIDKDPLGRYSRHWGALSFSKEVADSIDPSWATVGELLMRNLDTTPLAAFQINGSYFDCGTFSEYKIALQASDQA